VDLGALEPLPTLPPATGAAPPVTSAPERGEADLMLDLTAQDHCNTVLIHYGDELKEIRLELACIPSPHHQQTVRFTVAIGGH
jgi:hypothetical protein